MTPPTQTIGIVPHLVRPGALALAHEVIASLEARGVAVRVPTSDAMKTGLERWAHADDAFADGLTMAFSLGGDGTMLRTVDLVTAHGVPVLGVNVGHLGYLTAIQPDELAGILDRLLAGDFEVERRMTLAIDVYDAGRTTSDPQAGPPTARFIALNEAVLEKSSAGNTVRLGVSFNGEPFTEYSADGLIVATPTGSTAYAFSSRGPIVSPRQRALVVVPVSPHMLFDRSLVLHGSETVEVEVLDGRAATLFIDGRDSGLLAEGMVVVCRAGEHEAKLVTLGQRDFHGILKTKFGLTEPLTRGRGRGEG